jgi:hypothetical protein
MFLFRYMVPVVENIIYYDFLSVVGMLVYAFDTKVANICIFV